MRCPLALDEEINILASDLIIPFAHRKLENIWADG